MDFHNPPDAIHLCVDDRFRSYPQLLCSSCRPSGEASGINYFRATPMEKYWQEAYHMAKQGMAEDIYEDCECGEDINSYGIVPMSYCPRCGKEVERVD